jgi:predicted TIM-barrel fold metal-dependent hydrolase
MISRRDVVIGGALIGASELVLPAARVLAMASQPATQVKFDVPPGACDCHTHVFADPQRYPLFAGRTYTPETASVDEMRKMHRALHTTRVVVVQPSIYGTDNSATLDGVKQLGSNARGIAVIDDKTPDAALTQMNQAGIRGVRINLENDGQSDPALGRRLLRASAERVQGLNWHIQMFVRLSVIEGIKDELMASPVPVVFDHFGGAKAALGVEQEGFPVLLELVRSGKVYVKISAAYRCSAQAPDFPDVVPLAKALVAANPQRILWGSDWPHPRQVPGRSASEVTTLFQIDDGQVFNQLAVWAPEPALRKTILVENPARLFGF